MKNKKYQIARGGLAAALLLLGLSASAQPFSNPSGTLWDCTMSGFRNGLAVLQFGDTNFIMTEVIVPNKRVTTVDSRGTTSDGRSGDGTDTKFTSTNLFGGTQVTGPWSIDANGHIIGFFTETDGTEVNQLSFAGTMVTGKRLTLNVRSTAGNVVYRGKPSASLGNFSGQYYGIVSQSQRKFLDFFTLSNPGSSVVSLDPSDNVYDFVGSGPGYAYTNFAIISSWNKVAYVARMIPTVGGTNAPSPLRAVVGSFSPKSGRGNTSGMQESDTPTNRVSFKTYMIQSVSN